MSEIEQLRAENEALREAIRINNQEALNWKARLLEKIARLEAALKEAEGTMRFDPQTGAPVCGGI